MKNNSFSTVPSSTEGIEKQDLHVVGIGASAGGLEAIEQFFANMPSPNGMAFIIVQHLSSKYKSFMPELLAKKTGMNIKLTQDGMTLQEDTIYLNPPHHYVTVVDHTLRLRPYEENDQVKYPIDAFFHSLAAAKNTGAQPLFYREKEMMEQEEQKRYESMAELYLYKMKAQQSTEICP